MAEDVEPAAAPQAGWRITPLGWAAYALAAVVAALDQASKYWVLNVLHLADRPSLHVLPFFQLTMVWNQGVSFGLMRSDSAAGRWLLVAFALAVVIALAAWTHSVRRPLAALALGLVMGGAIGNNLIDRVRFGAVADFLDFTALGFPWVFNLADSAISIGVVLLLLDSFLRPKRAAGA